jgi:hypothetical protein
VPRREQPDEKEALQQREVAINRRPGVSESLRKGALIEELCGTGFQKGEKPGEIAGILDFGDVPDVALDYGSKVISRVMDSG